MNGYLCGAKSTERNEGALTHLRRTEGYCRCGIASVRIAWSPKHDTLDLPRRTMTYQERIVRDRAICGGQPVIRGTRVLVRTVLSYLAQGAESTEILAEFPSLTEPDIRAVIAFAAAAASEDLPAPTPIPPEIKVA